MSFVKEIKDDKKHNIVRMYQIDEVKTTEDALNWINGVRDCVYFITRSIYLCDFENRKTRGTKQLLAHTTLEEIREYMRGNHVDLILMNGSFADAPVVVSAGLFNYELSLTIREKDIPLLKAMEIELGLMKEEDYVND